MVPLNLYDGHQSLDEFIKAQMPELGLEYDRLLSDNRLLLLFDALNEMGPEGRRAISGFVKSLRDFVVSCRTKDYERDLEDVSGLTLITILFLDILGIRLAFEKILGPQWEQLWGSVGGCRALLDRHQKMRLRGESERFWKLITPLSTPVSRRIWPGIVRICVEYSSFAGAPFPFVLSLTYMCQKAKCLKSGVRFRCLRPDID